jgi:hypothetical protein
MAAKEREEEDAAGEATIVWISLALQGRIGSIRESYGSARSRRRRRTAMADAEQRPMP